MQKSITEIAKSLYSKTNVIYPELPHLVETEYGNVLVLRVDKEREFIESRLNAGYDVSAPEPDSDRVKVTVKPRERNHLHSQKYLDLMSDYLRTIDGDVVRM